MPVSSFPSQMQALSEQRGLFLIYVGLPRTWI